MTCSRFQFLMVVALLALSISAEPRLQPFVSDGCSSFPDGPLFDKSGLEGDTRTGVERDENTLWRDCCVEHDRAYWRGGTYRERVLADEALQHCVETVGEPVTARLMHVGVRLGGSPFWPTSYRWGYGWPNMRGYSPLTADELAQVQAYFPPEPLTEKEVPAESATPLSAKQR